MRLCRACRGVPRRAPSPSETQTVNKLCSTVCRAVGDHVFNGERTQDARPDRRCAGERMFVLRLSFLILNAHCRMCD